ncbi:MAG: cytochrome c3 family protein [Spirochaetota bacterium]|nr:cytochrome c3 family protein [Spirochaetota bacterium]
MFCNLLIKTFLLFLILLISSHGFMSQFSYARVSGECSNCHTMHNSQNGSNVILEGSLYSLTNNSCIGCHSHSNAVTYELCGCEVPVVYTIGGVSYDECLAGGIFYWVEHDGDIYGHNAISSNDGILSIAPGLSDSTGAISCTGSCHYKLTQWEWRWWGCPSQHRDYIGVGCVACYTPAHHKCGEAIPIADDEDGWFRFLAIKHSPVPGPDTDIRNV